MKYHKFQKKYCPERISGVSDEPNFIQILKFLSPLMVLKLTKHPSGQTVDCLFTQNVTNNLSFINESINFLSQTTFWTPGRADSGPINLVLSIHPSVHRHVCLQRAFLENASFNFLETWHEVRVP